MKKFKVLFVLDPYDEWGNPAPYTVEYVLADSKKDILASFSEDELSDWELKVYTEKEAVALAKRELDKTIREFKKSKGQTLEDLGWVSV